MQELNITITEGGERLYVFPFAIDKEFSKNKVLYIETRSDIINDHEYMLDSRFNYVKEFAVGTGIRGFLNNFYYIIIKKFFIIVKNWIKPVSSITFSTFTEFLRCFNIL
jgi:hypothetical protein